MPYIRKEDKENLDKVISLYKTLFIKGEKEGGELLTAGKLNYLITSLCTFTITRHNQLSYETINAVFGALECAKLEMYRRIAGPFEHLKCVENGDIFPPIVRSITMQGIRKDEEKSETVKEENDCETN